MTTKVKNRVRNETGATLIEFTIVAVFLFTMLIVICSGANLYFTHNALVESTRRGARFAATQSAANPAGTVRTTGSGACDSSGPSLTDIKNFTIYGNTAGTGPKLANNLDVTNICVQYSSFGVGQGTVSVSITGYNVNYFFPGNSLTISMPSYRTTIAGENAGVIP
jgi:Flp pilus assembly protein TadG